MQVFSLAIAFAAGVLSFLSPCVLPLVPGYLAFISGASIEDLTAQGADRRRIAARVTTRSLGFIAGFSVVFVAMGATATAVGGLLLAYRDLLAKVAGGVIILLGLHLAGVLRITPLYRERRFRVTRRPPGVLGAAVAGLAFAFGWSPCTGPVLGSILVFAGTQETVARGMVLLLAYSLGIGLPLLLTALATNALLGAFDRVKRAFRAVEIAGGGLLVLVGLLLITGYIHTLAGYLAGIEWLNLEGRWLGRPPSAAP